MKSKASVAFAKKIKDVVISEFAMMYGVSRATIYSWANGEAVPNDKNKKVIERMLGIPVAWWFRDV